MSSKSPKIDGANAGRSRRHNRQVVLGHVRSAGEIGRAEIARRTRLSIQAVSNIIADLEAEGLLVTAGRRSGGRGLPAVQYSINPIGGFALGIEVRPHAIFAALLDLNGKPHFSDRIELQSTDLEEVKRKVLDLKRQALTATGGSQEKLLGVGIVLPGPFSVTGLSGAGTDLPGWQGLDTEKWFQEVLQLPVIVENDANAAAMAEKVSGAAKGLDTFAFIYFGTGLGLGLVSHGRLHRGTMGNAGEIGHIPVPVSGGYTSLEQCVSRLSVEKHLQGCGITVQSAQDLSSLFQSQQPDLLTWLNQAVMPLSHGIHIVENLIDPEAVIIGGAMPDDMLDYLIANIKLSDASVGKRPDRTTPRVFRGTSGRMAATFGAAALVINRIFTPQFNATSE